MTLLSHIPYPDAARRGLLPWAVFFLLTGLFSGPALSSARAGEAAITHLILASRSQSLEVYLGVEGAFTPEIRAAVQSGVPVTFSFYLILERPRRLLPSRTLSDLTVTHTIRYNAIRETYTVTRSWEGFTPHVTEDYRTASRLMCSIADLPITRLEDMEKEQAYRLRAKARLSEFTLPLYLHHILFFLSFWDFETDWYTIDFTF